MTDATPEPASGRRRIPTVGLLVIGFLVVLAAFFGIGQLFAEQTPSGDPAPDVVVSVLVPEGEPSVTLDLADYRGTPVVVNFFAAWCPPCIQELPDIEAVHRELGDRVTFVGINVSDRASDALRLMDETGVSYVVGVDPTGEIHQQFSEFQVMPTTAFITADGSLAEVHPGILSRDQLRTTVEDLLLTDGNTAS